MDNLLINYENTGGAFAASDNAFSDDYGASDAANPESPNFGTKSYGNVARNENSYESDVSDGDYSEEKPKDTGSNGVYGKIATAYPQLTAKQESDLQTRIAAGIAAGKPDTDAHYELVCANLKLVLACIGRSLKNIYKEGHIWDLKSFNDWKENNFDEIFFAGYQKLWKAAQNYDPAKGSKGCKFSTYAYACLVPGIKHFILDEYIKWREKIAITISIDEPAYSSGTEEDVSGTFGETLPDETTPSPLDFLAEDEKKAVLNAALQTLKPTERKVLEYRFGMNGREKLTLEKIGKKLNIGRQGVNYIEQQAMKKLRRSSILAELRG